MIEVVVRVHDVPDRLVRDEPPDLSDDGQRPWLVLRCLHDRHEIAEFDRYAVMGAARDAPHTVGQLRGLNLDCR